MRTGVVEAPGGTGTSGGTRPRGEIAPGGGAAPGRRLPLLDVLRGAAILGTLMTNVWIFAGPGAELGILQGGMSTPLTDGSVSGAAEGIFRLLADGKFLSLLTILFGVGLAIQFESARRRGTPWPGPYKWRALFLFAEGTVHFVFVFAWDVLMGYAVTALLVAWSLTRSERFRKILMWGQGALHLTLMLAGTWLLAAADNGGKDTIDSETVALYAEGSYVEQVLVRLQNALVLRLEPVLTFGLLVFLFLLGVRLLRAGAFGDDERGRALRGRLLRWGLGIGVPLTVAAGIGGGDFFLIERYVAAPIVALGLIGLVGALLDRARGSSWLVAGLSAVGRCALSCYVLQNVLCVLVFYGFGLGLAAEWGGHGPWWVMGVWAGVGALLMGLSTLWLRRFAQGPLESVQKKLLGR
ncbi:DUF418 domain-containing protein [Streptomyces sp. NPDC087440]|uniref:DUF418 domain-containing protein n=1 Tax=Streptomyces sp. NPDC087440 TaxID=3365790 RepID=UPI0037F530ED